MLPVVMRTVEHLSQTIPASLPAPLEALREISTGYRRMRSVLLALIFKEYRGRSSRGIVAILASLIQPIIRTVFFTLLWYSTGRTAFHGVSTIYFIGLGVFFYMIIHVALLKLPGAIAANQALLGFPQVKPIDAILARFVIENMLLVVSFGGLFFIVYWFFDVYEPVRFPLELIGLYVMCMMLGLGFGLLLSVYAHLIEGIRPAFAFLRLPIFFTSGALHPVTGLSTEVREYLSWNPLFHIIEYARHYWFGTRLTAEHELQYPFTVSLGLLLLGVLSYYRHRIMLGQQ
jgi:capsular polysaccharide transport system permease protein